MNKKIDHLKKVMNKDVAGSDKQANDEGALILAEQKRADEAKKHSDAHHNKSHRKA
jgi:hypothetical protein